ncbi:MAG: hypothetical protein EBY22_09480 [Gammaproteobacteria bacterium]|nr:hypothetical protein [Gammaproteobacteria bacterium]
MSFWQKIANIGTGDACNEISFPYTQPIAVFVKGSSGNIKITTTISEQIEVALYIHGINASQQLADAQIQFDSAQQRLEVISRDSQWAVHTSIDISISAPAFTTIHANTTAGNIIIVAPNCTTIDASTTAGSITINAPDCATIDANTTAGNISIYAPAASIQYHTAAGTIDIHDTAQKLTFSTPTRAPGVAGVDMQKAVAQPLTHNPTVAQVTGQTTLQSSAEKSVVYVEQVRGFLQQTVTRVKEISTQSTFLQQTVTRIKEISTQSIFLQQLVTNIKETSAHFFGNDDQMTVPGTTDQVSTEFTIGHLFSIMVATCAAFVYPMALYRSDMGEVGDQYLVMAALCIAASTFALLHFAPQIFRQISNFIGTKILLVLMVLAFFGFGFREDDFYTEFLGLGSVVFGCLLVLIVVINILRTTVATNVLQFIMKALSVFVLLMGIDAVLISVSLTDNFYVLNEMATPLTNLHSYSTFIPQYVNLYQHFPRLLDFVGLTKYPQLSINIMFVFLQFMCFVTIGIAVYLNYYFMHRRSLYVAILFTMPLFFISSRPFWEYEKSYYILQLFVYSLIPNRIFAVFGIGAICIWLLRKANESTTKMVIFGIVYGIAASIGIYQSNDFGLFAAIGVGATIIFQPFQSWIKRIILATIFMVSTLIGFGVLLVSNTEWATLNSDYLFWFQRAFAGGTGSELIRFPGNGLMVIISVFVIWFCALKVYTMLRQHATTYAQDPLMAQHFAALMFMATTSVLGLSYYINRSVMSFQGSSMYIGWGVSLFLLYQLTQRMTAHQPQQYPLRYSNLAFQVLVLLPVAIALVYTPLSSRLNQDNMAIKKIFITDPNDMVNTSEYGELHIAQITNVYTALKPITPNIAFVGAFANLVQLYTDIPAANIFDHPANVTIGAPALKIYCDQIAQMPYDIYITDQPYLCENMLLQSSDKLGILLYLRKDYEQTHPQEWQQLRDVANICLVDPNTGAVVCPTQ